MDVPLHQTRRQRGRPVDSDQIFRTDVSPLRCAVRAARKPWVAVSGHPSNACVGPLVFTLQNIPSALTLQPRSRDASEQCGRSTNRQQRAARRLSSGDVM